MPAISRRPDDAIRITTAGQSRAADLQRRQRNYLVSMSLRTLCFVGALVVGPGWLRWVLVFGAIFLPYVAVVLANAVSTKHDELDLPEGLSGRREISGTSAGSTRQL